MSSENWRYSCASRGGDPAEIDAEHWRLDRLLRIVERMIFADEPADEVLAAYDSLMAAYGEQFQVEESRFEGLPTAESHRADHRRLLELAGKIRRELQATTGQRSLKALFEIEDALFQHMVVHDAEAFGVPPYRSEHQTGV